MSRGGPSYRPQQISRRREVSVSDDDEDREDVDMNGGGEDGDARDDLEEWTVMSYKPRPLKGDGGVASNLRKVQDQLQAAADKVRTNMAVAIETAKALEECEPDSDDVQLVAEGYCNSIEIRETYNIRVRLLKEFLQRLGQGGIENAGESYQQQAAERIQAYTSQTRRAKFQKDEDYIQFREDVWRVHHPDEICPPMSRWLPREDGDESDEEVEVYGATQNFRCPLTLQPYKEAMMNEECGHHYSKEGIMGLFEQNRVRRAMAAKITCPVPGCRKEVIRASLKLDAAFQEKADRFAKRQQKGGDESDEDVEDITQE